jgi:hypothetical protein
MKPESQGMASSKATFPILHAQDRVANCYRCLHRNGRSSLTIYLVNISLDRSLLHILPSVFVFINLGVSFLYIVEIRDGIA